MIEANPLLSLAVAPLLLLAAAAPELLKIGRGIYQGDKAKKFAKTPRPAYQIPAAMQQYLDAAKFNAMVGRMPGASAIENKFNQSIANSMRSIRESQQSPAAMLAGAVALDANTKTGLQDLAVKDAQFQNQAQGQYFNALNAMGQQQQAQWSWDRKDPYMAAMAAASALRNSSAMNIQNGLTGLTNIASYGIDKGVFNKTPSTNVGDSAAKQMQDFNTGLRATNDAAFAGQNEFVPDQEMTSAMYDPYLTSLYGRTPQHGFGIHTQFNQLYNRFRPVNDNFDR